MKAVVLAIALALAVPGAALAAPYRGGSVAVYLYTDRDSDGVISWNDDVSFTVTPPTGMTWAYTVFISCYQGWSSTRNPGTLVYTSGGLLKNYPQVSRLDSQAWSDGTGAHCEYTGAYPDGRKIYYWGAGSFEVAA